MGLFKKVTDKIGGGILDGARKLVDEVVTNKEEKAQILVAMSNAQMELNKIEASHKSIFVAGWRPFIGWVCGVAYAYNYIAKDIINYFMAVNYPDFKTLPSLQMEHLSTILGGMLGLGTLRTVEKLMNKTK